MLHSRVGPDDTAYKVVDCAHVLSRDTVLECATLVPEHKFPVGTWQLVIATR